MGMETGIQIQEIERFPPKINKNCSTPGHLIVTLPNSEDKEKILKAARDKRSPTYMGRNITLTRDLSTETWQATKGWQDIFRVLNEKIMQPRTLYPTRLSIRIQELKELPGQAETERICDHQTGSARNIKGDPIKEKGSPKK